MKVKVASLCPTLCNPMDCTVHGILQARILEWGAFPFSRGSSQPRDQTQVSRPEGGFFTSWATREAQEYWSGTFVSKVTSLLFNMLPRSVIAFIPRSKGLLISWLQSTSAVILEPKKIKSVTVSTFPPPICHEMMVLYALILVFWMLISSQLFHSPLSLSSRGSLVPLSFSIKPAQMTAKLKLTHYRDFWSDFAVVWSSYLKLLIFVVQAVKHLPAMQEPQESQVQSLSREDLLEEKMLTHYSILAWRVPWTEDLVGIQSMGSQKVGQAWSELAQLSLWEKVGFSYTKGLKGGKTVVVSKILTFKKLKGSKLGWNGGKEYSFT